MNPINKNRFKLKREEPKFTCPHTKIIPESENILANKNSDPLKAKSTTTLKTKARLFEKKQLLIKRYFIKAGHATQPNENKNFKTTNHRVRADHVFAGRFGLQQLLKKC